MCSQSNHRNLKGQLFTALLLIILGCAILLPLIGTAEDGGGDLPIPAPPPPNGEGQIMPDTTYILPGGEDSTFYYVD